MKFQDVVLAIMAAALFPTLLVAQAQSFVTNDRLTLGTEENRSASVRLGDLDGDGDLDAVVADGRHWPQQNYVFLNQGKAKFSVMRPLGTDGATTYACELADLDGDGDLDVVIGNDMALGQIFLNDGAGKFRNHAAFGEVSSVRSLTVADIDGDGDIDILATCRGRQNRIYLNDGGANFIAGPAFGTKNDATIDVAVGDVNQDGHLDLLLANRDAQQNFLLLNDGELGFAEGRPFGSGKDHSRAIAAGDLNGDGILDWVAGNIGQPNLLCLGDGKGGVLRSVQFGKQEGQCFAISVADLDQDGDLDIIAGNAGQPNAVFFNNGDATDFREEVFGDSNATYGLSIGDLNGDGMPDIATANSDARNFVFLNRLKKTSDAGTAGIESASLPVGQLNSQQKKQRDQTDQELSAVDQPFQKLAVYNTTNWPSFRGNGARGVAEGFSIRSTWNGSFSEDKSEGILWQATVPGLGHSSPVVFGNKIFLVTAVSSDGNTSLNLQAGGSPEAAGDDGEQDWLVLCYDKNTGEELWRKTAWSGQPRASRHSKATHANTSVSVDGKHVLAFLGSEGLHCYDMDGELLWTRDLGVINISKYGIGWGFSSSPAIDNDRIAIVCDDPDDPYVAALQLSDGQEIWRTSRQEVCERSWGTPLIHADGETTQVVVNGWPWILSYDLSSGEELWRIKGGGDNPIPSPFEAHGWFYITNAHGGPAPIFVIRPDSRGDLSSTKPFLDVSGETESTDSASSIDSPITKSAKDSIVWSTFKGGSYMSTPVVYGDYLYLGNSNGVIRCFHAKSGEKIFEERLGRKAGIIASLVAADGKIFCASENGNVYVLAAGPEFEIVATNDMGEPCFATPALSEGVIFIRTTNRLIAIK